MDYLRAQDIKRVSAYQNDDGQNFVRIKTEKNRPRTIESDTPMEDLEYRVQNFVRRLNEADDGKMIEIENTFLKGK